MPNVLEMQIIGDISGLDKSLKAAEKLQAEYTASIEKTSKELADNIIVSNGYKKAVSDLNTEFKKGAISQKEYQKGLENLKRDEKETAVTTQNLRKELANLKKEQKEVGGSFEGASKKVANGGNALMQFSRIAQDAPFGIAGIGNNITATVEAFGHLQKSTGSAGGALKAMAGSILGSGGILLAVSLLTTALTYMSQQGISVGDVFDKISGDFDSAKKAIQDVNNEAQKSAGSEIAVMNSLIEVAKNDVNTREERLAAVQKLQEEYPAYFGNLTKEQILNGDVELATKAVTFALIEKAKAQIIADKIAENGLKILQEQQKGQKTLSDFVAGKGVFALVKGANAMALLKISAGSASKEIDSLNKEQAALTKELEKSTKATTVFDAANKKATTDKKTKEKKSKKDTIDVTPKVTALPDLDTTAEVADRYLKAFRKVFGDKFNDIAPVELNIPPVVIPAVDDSEYLASLEIAKQAGDIFAQGTTSAIGALGSELAASLETGNAALDAFTGSVIQSLADVAAAQIAGLIAKQAIAVTSLSTDAAVATGNSVVAATETAAASGPAAAFVLPALVGAAIGFIAAAFSGIKFAHGGVVPGGSYTGDKIPAMLNSGEAVLNSQQQANTLMAVANGNANSLQGNRQSSNFTLETKLRGSDLLLVTKREERKR